MAVFGSESHAERRFKLIRLDLELSPLQVFGAIKGAWRDAFFLESLTGPRKLAEYSFIGFDPRLTIECYDGFSRVYEGGSIVHEEDGDPLDLLSSLARPIAGASLSPRLIGGLVGYVSYEASYLWEDIQVREKPGNGFPFMKFGLFDDALIYDHRRRIYYYSCVGNDRLSEVKRVLRDVGPQLADRGPKYTCPRSNMSMREFMDIVETGKEYIGRGDIFQVVLSRRLEFELAGDLLPFYLRLRDLNPSPYMYYLRLGDDELVGASPEMLIRVEGGRMATFPIAGTRPRMGDALLEEESDRELLSDEKERAEHVMLVDLARNDLAKVAEPGSVEVKDFMILVKYSHVKHIVSRVEARLRSGATMYDAFKAVFPAGTVSGAPKPRAMEIIEELEPVRRGPYAGALGYFSMNGCCDFAITIRTLIRRSRTAYIQAGAGIVWDSIPEREWNETQHKMMALVKALEEAGEICEF
ncbi:MAG: anthranilate synthase component I family protein [Nitrososphaerota archaeon]